MPHTCVSLSCIANNACPCSRRMLETKLAEAKGKKDTLKARAASAKTSKQIQVGCRV